MEDKIDFSRGSQARKLISEEFYNSKWQPFRKWFFEEITSEQLTILQNQFYEYLSSINKIGFFTPWFLNKYVYEQQCTINALERIYHIGDDQYIKSIFPPQQPFFIEKDGIKIKISSLRKLFTSNSIIMTNHLNALI